MGKARSAAAPRRFSVLRSAGLSAGGTCSLKEFLNTGRPLLRRFVHTSTVFQKCQHPKPDFFRAAESANAAYFLVFCPKCEYFAKKLFIFRLTYGTKRYKIVSGMICAFLCAVVSQGLTHPVSDLILKIKYTLAKEVPNATTSHLAVYSHCRPGSRRMRCSRFLCGCESSKESGGRCDRRRGTGSQAHRQRRDQDRGSEEEGNGARGQGRDPSPAQRVRTRAERPPQGNPASGAPALPEGRIAR